VATAAGALALAGVGVGSAGASEPVSGLVSDAASTATPAVVGGQCYPSVPDPEACRRVLDLLKVGDWIYASGIISDVKSGGVTTGGFHNIFRFSASTHQLDTTWKPHLYKSATSYRDAPVTGLAANTDGSIIYAAGAFTTASCGPGGSGVQRKGLAAITAAGAITSFNAKVCSGGGRCVVNDVKLVGGSLWLGGAFDHIAGQTRKALGSVDPSTGALTSAVSVPISGVVTTTAGTKVAQISINPQRTRAAVIGNFAQVGGKTHKELVLLIINASGGSTSASPWNAPTHLDASESQCSDKDTWARGVDWDPTGQFLNIAASGGGGFDAYPALCDSYTRFKGDDNANAVPLIVNATGFDSLFTVCDTGDYVYTGGHNKNLNQAVRINGVKVKATQQTHYGIGAITVNPSDPDYGKAVLAWNNSSETGRGAGWASCLSDSGSGVYIGGDASNVNGDPAIQRLAFFPAG